MTRQVENLKTDWRFIKKDVSYSELPDLNFEQTTNESKPWEDVRVPHDWAIEGPFARENDLQHTSIWEDGLEKSVDQTGRTGGLPITGTGWYYRKLALNPDHQGQQIYVEFDGVMSNSTVYINGEKVGSRPYGYSSFSYEITDYIEWEKDNILAVKVEPESDSSRWYPGAGIYRHVRLVCVSPVHIAHWGIEVTTPQVTAEKSVVNVATEIKNQNSSARDVYLKTRIIDPQGKEVASTGSKKYINNKEVYTDEVVINNPFLWNLEDPYLYRVVSEVEVEGEIVDQKTTTFGLRSLDFDKEQGFFLNGKNLKLQGVCLHHDNGPLGAAVNHRAIERKLEILQDMGCNAVRTSHNPPAPELLELCDKMGFLVIDEAFDEWEDGKVENGYHNYFAEWAKKDLEDMIKRDRNHPSIIMWSIGNEIREQGREDGVEVGQFLTDICHQLDPSRPVTAGFNIPQAAIENGLAEVVDIVGWNYECDKYKKFKEEHPDWIMYGSETESCVSSRGEYFLPAEEHEEAPTHDNLQLSSYDLSATEWGYIPDYEFAAQEECPFIMGEFVWTGFDYLGEPTPYYTEWPSRSSYFGIIDLCGIPKDRYYLYKSQWSEEPTLHLLPHWNWEGKEGENIPVFCYTNYDKAELFVNGKSQGIRKKKKDSSSVVEHYRLMWKNVKYEPGNLKVVAYDNEDHQVKETEIVTADLPAQIELQPDRKTIVNSGDDLCYVQVRALDNQDNFCPQADDLINFSLEGDSGEIVAVGNGNPATTEPFKANYRHLFNGQCMVIIRARENKKEPLILKAEAEGLKSATTEIDINDQQG
ncbi:MAG: beta-galactosidase GalB [Halanaerobiaceae bacterium]